MWGCNQRADAGIEIVLYQVTTNVYEMGFFFLFGVIPRGESITNNISNILSLTSNKSLFFNDMKFIIKALWGPNSKSHVFDHHFKPHWWHWWWLSTKDITHDAIYFITVTIKAHALMLFKDTIDTLVGISTKTKLLLVNQHFLEV